MGIKKTAKAILKDNVWIIEDFASGKSDEVIADSIRRVADANEGFENAIFELGLERLMKAGKKVF